jgi:hypothetical protein
MWNYTPAAMYQYSDLFDPAVMNPSDVRDHFAFHIGVDDSV